MVGENENAIFHTFDSNIFTKKEEDNKEIIEENEFDGNFEEIFGKKILTEQ